MSWDIILRWSIDVSWIRRREHVRSEHEGVVSEYRLDEGLELFTLRNSLIELLLCEGLSRTPSKSGQRIDQWHVTELSLVVLTKFGPLVVATPNKVCVESLTKWLECWLGYGGESKG